MSQAEPRLFFALWPGPAERARLVELQNRLAAPGRRIAAERLHLTLAFLGEVERARLDTLASLAALFCVPTEALVLDRLGWFEQAGSGWLGCNQAPVAWTGQVRALNERLAESGFRVDRRDWVPHVTLYRNLRKPFDMITVEAVQWTPEVLCLVRSDRLESGPKYTVLRRWP